MKWFIWAILNLILGSIYVGLERYGMATFMLGIFLYGMFISLIEREK
ncbi:MAG: hypothetical protein WC445_01100 [Patescibacteria group bacterium]